MADSEVNKKRIADIAGDTRELSKKLKKTANNIKDSVYELDKACEKLAQYDGKYIRDKSGDEVRYDLIDGKKVNEHKVYGYRKVSVSVSGHDYCDIIVSNMGNIADDITLNRISNEEDSFADYIAEAENKLNKVMEGNPDDLWKAYTELFATTGIASNATDAKKNDMIPEEAVSHNQEDWMGGVQFAKQGNGTYLIYKIDKNGNRIAMGYTTAEGKRKFYNKLCNAVGNDAGNDAGIARKYEYRSDGYYDLKNNKKYTSMTKIKEDIVSEGGDPDSISFVKHDAKNRFEIVQSGVDEFIYDRDKNVHYLSREAARSAYKKEGGNPDDIVFFVDNDE